MTIEIPRQLSPQGRLSIRLHRVAGVVFLIFGLSHLIYVGMAPYVRRGQNPVFYLLTNGCVFTVVGSIEILLAGLCFLHSGRQVTNIAIWTFIGVILWYRWAFYYLGGVSCGCMGVLRVLAHLNSFQEQTVSILALVVLAATTLPSWLRTVKKVTGARLPFCLIFLASAIAALETKGESFIEIHGQYHGAEYNQDHTRNNVPEVQASFTVMLSESAWYIVATNETNNATSEMWCDGTNTYERHPAFIFHGSNVVLTAISPPPVYRASGQDFDFISVLWVAYALCPRLIQANDHGLVDIPLPWENPRERPLAYGYKWLIEPTADGRFIDNFSILRDHALDLDDNQELLRPEFWYPQTLEQKNRDLAALDLRHSITNGFLDAIYICSQWFVTNSLRIPAKGNLTCFKNDFSMTRNPFIETSFQASEISVHPNESVPLPNPSGTNVVFDYRYRLWNSNSMRLVDMVRYTLREGDSWKSTIDPILLAERAKYLKHLRRYDDFGDLRRKVLVWSSLGALIFVPGGIMLMTKRIRLQNTKQNI